MTHKPKTPYQTLGIKKTASPAEIKSAYRTMARKCHPDVAGEDGTEQFKALASAYRLLSDDRTRRFYDETGIENDVSDTESVIMSKAVGIVKQLVQQIITGPGFDPGKNIVDEMTMSLRKIRKGINDSIAKIDIGIARVDAVIKRLDGCDESDDPVMDSIDDTMKGLRASRLEQTRSLEIIGYALKIVEKYSYRVDEQTMPEFKWIQF